jgi:signal transduction histidine kinase
LTTPSYTTSATERPAGDPFETLGSGIAIERRSKLALLQRVFDMARRPLAVQATLDLVAVASVAFAFGSTVLSAELLFHCVFVTLVLHAFLFGLRGTLIRIGVASVPLMVYANAGMFGLTEPPLELTEWPLMFVIAVLVAWMADLRRTTSRRYASLFRLASERLLTVQEDERRRIAGELHDNVGQILTALTLTLDAAASERDASGARARIRAARGLADSALGETRDLSHRIRPARLEERGLIAALGDLASQSAFPVAIHSEPEAGDPLLLTPTSTVEVFRVVQEALANAARHSGAGEAEVSIGRDRDQLTVTVSDGGRGFDREAIDASGIGLAGMLERARLLGGQLSVESAPGAGTRVLLSVPVAASANQ